MGGGKEVKDESTFTEIAGGRVIVGSRGHLVAPDGTPLEGLSSQFTGKAQYRGRDGEIHVTEFIDGLPAEGGGGSEACTCGG